MGKTVVVIGGSIAGLGVTHRLLKSIKPSEKSLKVILISKSSHLYWNLASVRAIIPGLVPDEKLFHAVEPGLTKYPKASVEFVLGAATSVDPARKSVRVSTSPAGDDQDIHYDYLVLATGTRSANPGTPWKLAGPHEETSELLKTTRESVKAAGHIVVAGAGATGVEVSAEIRAQFPKKEVLLLSAGDDILNGDSIAGRARKAITDLGVTIKTGAKVTGTKVLDSGGGRTEVTLESGETIETDLYLPTMGLTPNTEFLAKEWLTEKGYAEVDEYLRVKGTEDVWACGDIVSKPSAGFMHTDKQAESVAKNVSLAIQGKPQVLAHGMSIKIFMCSAGPNGGAGRIGVVPAPSFLVKILKSGQLAMDMAPKVAAEGKLF